MLTLTPEQQSIVDHDLSPGSALKVIAYAGTGKTSTLVEAASKYSGSEVLYLAFNKSVESEALMRFPCNTTAKTGHALAYAAIGNRYRSNLGNLYNWQLQKAYSLTIYEASLLVRSFDNFCNSADLEPGEAHVEPDYLSKLSPTTYVPGMVEKLENLWDDVRNRRGRLPMPHSGYLKMFQITQPNLSYPVVMLDEAQDTNPVMHDLVLSQARFGSRIYLVGDPYQQIYSWRGAVDAMSRIEAPTLRLTQSFRFGPAIADMASMVLRAFFKETTPLQGNPNVDSAICSVLTTPYTIIARTNSALVEEAYRQARAGRHISVEGGAAFNDTLSSITNIFHLWSNQKHLITEARIKRHSSFKAAVAYAEETLDVELGSKLRIVDRYGKDWPDVRNTIEGHLSSSPDLHLSTCHKAKGLEWDRVGLAGDFEELVTLNPDGNGGFAVEPKTPVRGEPRDDSEIPAEEVNLLYVALTRAKRVLQPTTSLRQLLETCVSDVCST